RRGSSPTTRRTWARRTSRTAASRTTASWVRSSTTRRSPRTSRPRSSTTRGGPDEREDAREPDLLVLRARGGRRALRLRGRGWAHRADLQLGGARAHGAAGRARRRADLADAAHGLRPALPRGGGEVPRARPAGEGTG